jgi:hypothetical protein
MKGYQRKIDRNGEKNKEKEERSLLKDEHRGHREGAEGHRGRIFR